MKKVLLPRGQIQMYIKYSFSTQKRLIRTNIFSRLIIPERVIVYSYFMPICSIVKTITLRYRGLPDALLYETDEFKFEPHWRHCVVSSSEMLYPLLSTGLTKINPKMTEKIVDWDVKNQIKQTFEKYLAHFFIKKIQEPHYIEINRSISLISTMMTFKVGVKVIKHIN